MRALVLCSLISVLATARVSGRQSTLVVLRGHPIVIQLDSTLRPAANAALGTLRKLANATNYRALGFNSPSEAATAVLGDSLLLSYVRLDSLREYKFGGDPRRLLNGGDRVLYRVLVGGATRSSVTLARGAAGWKGVSYGNPNTTRLTWRILRRSNPPSPYFLVNVLALGVEFLAFETGGTLKLVPLRDDLRNRWKAETARPADRVFAQLAVDAKAYNGLPR